MQKHFCIERHGPIQRSNINIIDRKYFIRHRIGRYGFDATNIIRKCVSFCSQTRIISFILNAIMCISCLRQRTIQKQNYYLVLVCSLVFAKRPDFQTNKQTKNRIKCQRYSFHFQLCFFSPSSSSPFAHRLRAHFNFFQFINSKQINNTKNTRTNRKKERKTRLTWEKEKKRGRERECRKKGTHKISSSCLIE